MAALTPPALVRWLTAGIPFRVFGLWAVTYPLRRGVWPYDDRSFEAVLNVAVGGNWPGAPNARTPAKAVMQVDWYTVRGIGAS